MKNKKLFLLLLLIPLIVFFIGRSFSLPDDEEEEEPELDNWEISTVFYDSTVDNGLTPLTEINWDVGVIDYDNDTSSENKRTITIQINYKNRNVSTSYGKNQLKMKVTGIYPTNDVDIRQVLSGSFTVGANDNNHVGYDWRLDNASSIYYSSFPTAFIFSNENPIEKNSNFEGTIQIVYTLTPRLPMRTEYIQEIDNQFTSTTNAKLYTNSVDNIATSDDIIFNYHIKSIYNWKRLNYTLEKKAYKLAVLDYLSEYDDYTWVKYTFTIKDGKYTPATYYPDIDAKQVRITDNFPADVVILDQYYNQIQKNQNGDIIFDNDNLTFTSANNYNRYYTYIFAGYPNSLYLNNNNESIVNEASLDIYYQDGEDFEHADDSSVSIDLNQYQFSGSKVNSMLKGAYTSLSTIFYESLIGEDVNIGTGGRITFGLHAETNYNGELYDYKIADDALLISDTSSSLRFLNDDEYYYESILFPGVLKDGYSNVVDANKYKIKLYVRRSGQEDYSLYEEFYNGDDITQPKEIIFESNDNVVSYYFYIENLDISLRFPYDNNTYNIRAKVVINNAHNIPESGTIYNTAYIELYKNGELDVIKPSGNYVNFSTNLANLLRQYDSNTYNRNMYRMTANISYKKYSLATPTYNMRFRDYNTKIVNDVSREKFIGTNRIEIMPIDNTSNNYTDYELENFVPNLDDKYRIIGYRYFNLLPLGNEIESTPEEILSSLISQYSSSVVFLRKNGDYYTFDDIIDIISNNTVISIEKNYKNSGRTLLLIDIDFGEPLIPTFSDTFVYYSGFCFDYQWTRSYDAVEEYGNSFSYVARIEYKDRQDDSVFKKGSFYSINVKDDGALDGSNNPSYDEAAADINGNGITDETIFIYKGALTVQQVISTNQDVQISVQSDKSNFATGKVETSKNSEYEYKLRVRTGSNIVTNLVIYDSIEEYTKNSQQELVKASKGKNYWQGEFLGIDTSYAESKGYTVNVYYNESPTPGSLKDDNTWQEYTNDTDKSKVKSLAFKYLNEDGTAPAVLPANSLTYVLIKMKSPDADYTTYAYNGCWTEWNAIDPITERPVDFITGINSNITKVALPQSVELEDTERTIEKKWIDGSNTLGLRPNNVTFQIISNGDIDNAVDIMFNGTGNTWSTTIEVPNLDIFGNEIEYSVTEKEISANGIYSYVPEINGLSITNVLNKEITVTKRWIDNSNSYLTRPENITYIVKQNGNDYQTISFNGDLTADEWSKVISVPVYDAEGSEYTYTVTEEEIEGYSTTCESLTCTNTLTGNDTITIKKVWNDNNNSYNTRPNSIDIKLKQNGNDYQTVTLSGNTNTWESDSITIPKYDSNGVKYEYTISETQLNKYGLVVYDQANYQVTNTLKENIAITVTKKWVDGSNEQGIRPNELKINLLRNNEQYQEITLSGTEDIWTTTIEVPKYDDNQVLYTYTIKEITDDLNSDYSNITYGEDLSVTNKLKKEKDIQVSKIWDDYDNKYITRPDKVVINLLRNGELYQELELNNNNSWKMDINDLDVYDDNGKLYKYTIEENISNQVDRYKTITYDQTSYTITNKLTDIPKVSLYFNVKNGYTASGSNDIQYDSEGLNKILEKYKINGDDPYEFDFKLENVDTGEIVNGKLNTQGILKFDNISYGTYRATEEKDKYFVYVLMNEIEAVNGVTFKEDENGGTIAITPTGKDILYGVNVVNKIEYEPSTPITSAKRNLFIYLLILLIVFIGLYFYKKEYMK